MTVILFLNLLTRTILKNYVSNNAGVLNFSRLLDRITRQRIWNRSMPADVENLKYVGMNKVLTPPTFKQHHDQHRDCGGTSGLPMDKENLSEDVEMTNQSDQSDPQSDLELCPISDQTQKSTKSKWKHAATSAITEQDTHGAQRCSTESIGEAADLQDDTRLNPNHPRGEDHVDFWDKVSQYSLVMRKDAQFFFQHPYVRLVVAYLVTICNFLIYAEDPVAHSNSECNIIVVGNIYSFVVTKYPPVGAWAFLKVLLWLVALLTGLIVGKFVVHKLLLKRLFRLQMFKEDNGSFMVMFIISLVFLYIFSWLYNAFLSLAGPELQEYQISGLMNMRNSSFMRAAACGTWLGDFFTAWMVTDIMLQERFYPTWAISARRWWVARYHRIILFWIFAVLCTFLVVLVIATDWVRWDDLNAKLLATNELSRAFLASFILVMDLLILMQDWEFPHFINHFDIKLPGLNISDVKIRLPKCIDRFEELRQRLTIHITGKWFQYGIIFLVMILDLNMWKNQIFYEPQLYGQYVDEQGFIYSLPSADSELTRLHLTNGTFLDLTWRRSNTNPKTNRTWAEDDLPMESRYRGFHIGIKAIAFLPSLAAFILFVTLIIIYGRAKPTKADPYAGRLQKLPKRNKSSIFSIVMMKFRSRRARVMEPREGDASESPEQDIAEGNADASDRSTDHSPEESQPSGRTTAAANLTATTSVTEVTEVTEGAVTDAEIPGQRRSDGNGRSF